MSDTSSLEIGFPIPVTAPDTIFFTVSASDSGGRATPARTLQIEIH
jgi:hypothetical protein